MDLQISPISRHRWWPI